MKIKINKEVVKNFFYFWSAVLILLLVSELVWPGSVIYYVNINYIFVLWNLSWLLLL